METRPCHKEWTTRKNGKMGQESWNVETNGVSSHQSWMEMGGQWVVGNGLKPWQQHCDACFACEIQSVPLRSLWLWDFLRRCREWGETQTSSAKLSTTRKRPSAPRAEVRYPCAFHPASFLTTDRRRPRVRHQQPQCAEFLKKTKDRGNVTKKKEPTPEVRNRCRRLCNPADGVPVNRYEPSESGGTDGNKMDMAWIEPACIPFWHACRM